MPIIYTLEHPVTGEIKYVGKTQSDINSRLKQHIYSHKKRPVNMWVRNLIKDGLVPIIDIIETVDYYEANNTESFWINQFKVWGFDLLNLMNNNTKSSFKPKNYNIEQKRDVIAYTGSRITIYDSVYKCAKDLGFECNEILSVLDNRKIKHNGYYFIYK